MDTLNEKEIRVLRYLVETIYRIRDCHNKGDIYYKKELSSIAYGWHNIKFPPEYREYTLSKKRGKPLCKEYDFYYLFMAVSELIHDDFESLSRVLRSEIRKKKLEKSLAGWDSELTKAILLLIRNGTARNPVNRINNYDDMIHLPEWELIQKKYTQYTLK